MSGTGGSGPHEKLKEPNKHANGLASTVVDPPQPLQLFQGPPAKGKQTSVELFNRAQLASSDLLPALTDLINVSFRSQPTRAGGGILADKDRLRYDGQLLEEIGHAPDTFVYIISRVDSGELIGTAYASRYEGVEQWPEGGERTWSRLGVTDASTEAWDLHMMAVHPGYQRQGLANYLIDLVNREIARRPGAGAEGKRLVLYISTIKQTNEAFYLGRGFKEAYSVDWPAGHFGSAQPFTVCHMDREILGHGIAS